MAEKAPHPVPVRRAEGRTKTRLRPDPVRGPVVGQIFTWRATERLGYARIAARLNADPGRYPPPQPVDAGRAAGRWTTSAVRDIVANPNYTGYMVWPRRASKQDGGRCNPPSEWVWSPGPAHAPLVSREVFDAARSVAGWRQRSRTDPGPNTHPQTRRSYLLRSNVVCGMCGRRMFGKTRKLALRLDGGHVVDDAGTVLPRHRGIRWAISSQTRGGKDIAPFSMPTRPAAAPAPMDLEVDPIYIALGVIFAGG